MSEVEDQKPFSGINVFDATQGVAGATLRDVTGATWGQRH